MQSTFAIGDVDLHLLPGDVGPGVVVAGRGLQRNLLAVDGEWCGAGAERHAAAARRYVRDVESPGQSLGGLRSRAHVDGRSGDSGPELFERAAVGLVADLDDP